MISLIVSDIIGDPMEFISSGPTVLKKFDSRTPLEVLKDLNLEMKIPQNILRILNKNLEKKQGLNFYKVALGF